MYRWTRSLLYSIQVSVLRESKEERGGRVQYPDLSFSTSLSIVITLIESKEGGPSPLAQFAVESSTAFVDGSLFDLLRLRACSVALLVEFIFQLLYIMWSSNEDVKFFGR